MKISYNLNTQDLLAFYKQGLRKNSIIFKNFIFIIGVIIALLISYFNNYSDENLASNVSIFSTFTNNYWFVSAFNLVLVTVSIFLVRKIIITFYKFRLSKETRFQGNRDLELSKNKIIFSSQSSKTEYLLSVIQTIENCRDHYFIYTNSISAIIIPKSTEKSDEFIKQLSEITNLEIRVY